MKFTLDNKQKFEPIIFILNTLSENASIVICKDKFSIKMMGSNKITLIDIEMNQEFFKDYEFEGNEEIDIGVSLNALYKIIKAGKKNAEMELIYNLENENLLQINFYSGDNVSEFNLKLLDIS